MARFDLTGKVALVTGGAEGIGQELSTTLAEQGADIAIFDVKEELMKKNRRAGYTGYWQKGERLALRCNG